MSAKPAPQGSFTIYRDYDAACERVFAAWSEPAQKARWFVGPAGWRQVVRRMDFSVGGEEHVHGRFPDGKESVFVARYHEIVPGRRLVYVYDMFVNGAHMSVSLATIEMTPLQHQTRLTFTEHAVYVDGVDGNASRRQGTAGLLDNIAACL